MLINLKVESHQDLIALSERGLPKIRWCGTKTTAELTRLLEGVRLDYVPMHSSLAQPSGCAEGAAASEASAPRMAAVPSKWSILNSTLAGLFTDAASSSQYAWPETIKLPPADLVRLRAAGIFPEDTPYLLCSFTIEYLLEAGLSDAALSALLHAITRVSQLPGDALPTLAVKPQDRSLYAGFPEGLLDPLIVPDFPFPALLGFVDAPTSAVAWNVVAKITERSVIKTLGFSVTALRAIQYLWGLQRRAGAIAESAAAGIPTDSYLDFDLLLDRYLQVTRKDVDRDNSKRSDLEHRLVREHNSPHHHNVSLQELGKDFGVSSERVRQIEVKLLRRLNNDANLKHLDYLWHLLDRLMITGGGTRYAYELCLSLQAMNGWSSPPSEETLAVLMGFSPKYRVATKSSPLRMTLTAPCCVGCEIADAAVFEALTPPGNGSLSFHQALDVVRSACHKEQCPGLRNIASFSLSLAELIADSQNLLIQDQALHLERPQTKSILEDGLEAILLSAPDGMHFKEACRMFKLLHPETSVTARSVHRQLTNHRWAVLWGPGTFKHRSLLSIPTLLINEIMGSLAAVLDLSGVPCICANGIHYDRYADRLRSEGVPNSRALYSCMKIVGSPAMSFEELPYVLGKDHAGPRPKIAMLLEQFIAKAHRAVSHEEVKGFELGILGIPIPQASCHLKHIPNILQIGDFLLHIDHVPIVTGQLRRIIDAIPSGEDGAGLTEAALYRAHQNACRNIGIIRPSDLFCFMEQFFPGTVKLHRKPIRRYQVTKHGAVTDVGVEDAPKSALATAESPASRTSAPPVEWVYAYLEDLEKPCLTKHLFEAFRTNPLHNNIYQLWLGKTHKVLWYTRDCVIARKVLGWDDEKQYAIETLALMHLEQAAGLGKPYGSCRAILTDHSGQLPELAHGLAWTPVLLHGLLVSGSNFVHIGRQKDLFVSVDNPHGIQTLNDLLYRTLLTGHGGCAPKKEFMAACEKKGISLAPSALFLTGKDPRVVIDGDVIRAAELEAGI
ncbi:sigma factor-like helix-turn-helix DNA-binding protein [Geomonas terrae]|uniref:sigma factor-like helix-turn-helix DNA-binding protein n=1 Tax=Geomonas terrae TaxID=2562681 RepID=UPI0013A5CA60|nr:sigma factor-like helix-turn-helix DNA-binding protein [Geomonas terrae]